MPKVQTVTGTIDASEMGRTLAHEHLVLAFPGWEFDSHYSDREATVNRLVAFVTAAKEHGIKTIVDPAPIELGRDVTIVAEVAERAEINLISTTGFYQSVIGIPTYWRMRTLDEITDFMVEELTNGVGKTGIKPGAIKVATKAGDQIPRHEETMLRAAGRTSKATGVPVITHTEQGSLGPEQVEVLTSEGVSPGQILVGHCDQSSDIRYHNRVIETGAFVGFDQIGWQFYESQPSDETRLTVFTGLIAAGHTKQLIMSQDRTGVWHNRLTAAQQEVAKEMDRTGYTYIFTSWIPALKEAGISDETIDSLLIDNPRRMFEGS